MDEQPTSSADLLELLDLEERELLARDLDLPLPTSLSDPAFRESIAGFSSTTLLHKLLRFRRPFLTMLQEINSFLSTHGARGRTTTRTVVLPGDAEAELRLVFDQGLRDAIAKLLNAKLIDETFDSIDEDASKLCAAVDDLVRKVRGSYVRSTTEVSRMMRHHPTGQFVARSFEQTRHVYHPRDKERIAALQDHARILGDDLQRLAEAGRHRSGIPAGVIATLSKGVEATKTSLDRKRRDMEAFAPRQHDRWEPRPEIQDDDSRQIIERLQLLRERILAACAFEEIATPARDFLNLYLWKQKWRVYELWMLVHVASALQRLGFAVDITSRVSDAIWDLRFTRDDEPVAVLRGERGSLLLYYQWFVQSDRGGDMPDIVLKDERGDILAVLDPKCGRSYSMAQLADVALRYAEHFDSRLSVVHNFYPVAGDTGRELSTDVVILGSIRPGTEQLRGLEGRIRSVIPKDLLPEGSSLVAVVDVSGSTVDMRDSIAERLREILTSDSGPRFPGSEVILYDTSVVQRIAINDNSAPEIAELVSRCAGGGTDLTRGIREGISALRNLREPRHLFVLSDGQDSGDLAVLVEDLRDANVTMSVFEGRSAGDTTPLEKLCRAVDGHYEALVR